MCSHCYRVPREQTRFWSSLETRPKSVLLHLCLSIGPIVCFFFYSAMCFYYVQCDYLQNIIHQSRWHIQLLFVQLVWNCGIYDKGCLRDCHFFAFLTFPLSFLFPFHIYLFFSFLFFLGATKHLYNKLCPSVGRSVTHSFDDPHVAPYWPTWPCFSLALLLFSFKFFFFSFKRP